MGCICSFFKTLTSYHGSHLTAHQVTRQRQQRARQARPARDSPPPPSVTPEKPPIPPFPGPPGSGRPKGPGGEEEKLLPFSAPKKKQLGQCGKQSSFSQSRFSASFNKS